MLHKEEANTSRRVRGNEWEGWERRGEGRGVGHFFVHTDDEVTVRMF